MLYLNQYFNSHVCRSFRQCTATFLLVLSCTIPSKKNLDESKNVTDKSFYSNLFSKKIVSEVVNLIFVLQKWLWTLEMSFFPVLHSFKMQSFYKVSLFIGKNITNFRSPRRIFNKPTDHNLQTFNLSKSLL